MSRAERSDHAENPVRKGESWAESGVGEGSPGVASLARNTAAHESSLH